MKRQYSNTRGFSRTARRMNRRNFPVVPMRGGIRL